MLVAVVLVLSEAVLVLVIDVSMLLRDTIEFHRHPGQHRDDPIEYPIHRGSLEGPSNEVDREPVNVEPFIVKRFARSSRLVSITSTVAGATEHEHEFLDARTCFSPECQGENKCFEDIFVCFGVRITLSGLLILTEIDFQKSIHLGLPCQPIAKHQVR